MPKVLVRYCISACLKLARSVDDLIVSEYTFTKENETRIGHCSPGAVATVQSYLPVVRGGIVVVDVNRLKVVGLEVTLVGALVENDLVVVVF